MACLSQPHPGSHEDITEDTLKVRSSNNQIRFPPKQYVSRCQAASSVSTVGHHKQVQHSFFRADFYESLPRCSAACRGLQVMASRTFLGGKDRPLPVLLKEIRALVLGNRVALDQTVKEQVRLLNS